MFITPRPLTRRALAALIAPAAAALVASGSARGSFPGANGMLSYAGDCGTSLRTIDADGANDFPLWAMPETDLFRPAQFSPDGNRLLFARRIGPNGTALDDFDLYVLDLSDGRQARIVQNPAQESFAAWSPDGSQVAFESNRDTPAGQWQNEVYIVDLATGAQRRLTHNDLYDGQLDWSPDGRYIVVARSGFPPPYDDGASELIRVDVANGGEMNLTQTPLADEDAPSFAPNGTRIAYTYSSNAGLFRDVYSMATDGSDRQRLTTDPDDDRFPVWAPDRGRIAFSRGAGPLVNLVTMAATGGDERYLTHHTGPQESHLRDCLAGWQPCVTGTTVRCHSRPPAGVPPSGGGADPGSGSGNEGATAPQTDTSSPRLRVLSRLRVRHRRKASLRVACSERCTARLGLRTSRRHRLAGPRRFTLAAPRSYTLRWRLRAVAPRRLRRVRLVGSVVDAAGNRHRVDRRLRQPVAAPRPSR